MRAKACYRWVLVSVFVMVFWPSPSLFAMVQCAVSVADQGDPEPLPPGSYLLRVHPDLGLHEVLVINEYTVPTGEVTRRYRRKVLSGKLGDELQDQTPRGADWHFSQVRHIARRVLEVYNERNRFTPHFLAGYMEDSRLYINDTEYVEVRAGRTGPLLAANRFVLAPYALVDGQRVPRGPVVKELYGGEFDRFREPGELQPDSELPRPVRRLPEAHYLGDMDLPLWTWTPRNSEIQCGLEVEMGAYLVEQVGSRDEQEIWKAELWVQLLHLAHNDLFDDGYNYNGLVIYSFGDRLARRVYEPLGFEPIGDKPVIADDGEEWWPLAYFVTSLDKASARAAEGKGAWLQNGEYFKSRLAVNLAGSPAFNAAALPAWKPIFALLESDDEYEEYIAAVSITRLAQLQSVHSETLLKSAPDSVRAERARQSHLALDPIMRELEEALLYLVDSPRYKTRYSISNLVPGLLVRAESRNFITKRTLLSKFICVSLADSDPVIPLEIAYRLRNSYTYADILEGQEGPLEAIQTRALKELHDAGLGDAEIDEVVHMVHRGMTLPWYVGDLDAVYVQKCTHIQGMGFFLNRASRGNAKIVENLLILTAARGSTP